MDPLTDEGTAFFAGVIAGLGSGELMFAHTQGRHKGKAWGHSQQRRSEAMDIWQ
jgi:hypothetical protein